MYTQCPECDTIFRVNAVLLRTAQGQVRCGVCDATFDAIRFLTDEIESGVNAQSASHIHYEPKAPDPGGLPVESGGAEGTDDPQVPSTPLQTGHALPLVAFEVADAANEWWATPLKVWPEETAEAADGAPPAAAPLEAPALDAAPASDTEPGEDSAASPAARVVAPDNEDAGDWARLSALDSPAGPSIAPEDDDRVLHRRRRSRGAGFGGGLACGVLVLALLAQWMDHERNNLATDPRFAEVLSPLYSALGRPLEPRWDVTAYDIREWAASPDTETKTIRLKARIRNRGARAQPWPLLRVIFEDRYGNLVARRDFTPSEYLPGHPQVSALMDRGALVEADLTLADPGAQVVSYEIDACLAHGTDVGCGADAKGSPGP